MIRRPNRYCPQIDALVCDYVRGGGSLIGLYRRRGMPAQSTLSRWMARYPEFRARYEAACRARAARARLEGVRDAGAGGRPTGYTAELGETICALVSSGAAVRDLDSFPDIPSRATVFRWLDEHADFRRAYGAACEQRADGLADEALTIAGEALGDGWAPTRDGKGYVAPRDTLGWAKLQIDTIKWRVSKLAPKKYGLKPVDSEPAEREMTYEEALDELA